MKKLVLFVIAAMTVTGCTKSSPVVCKVQDAVVSLTAATVASQIACKNLDAVKADIAKEVAKLNLCKVEEQAKATAASTTAPAAETTAAPASTGGEVAAAGAEVKPMGPIGDLICAPVVEGLMGGLLKQIPASWECTGGKPADDLKKTILEACKKAI